MGRSRSRTDVSAAVNAEQSSVVDFGPDPRGWGMFASLSGAHRRDLTTKVAVIDTSHTDADGWLRPLQRLRGLAPLALGSGRPVLPRNGQIGDARSDVLDDPAMRVLSERWTRQSGGPA